MKRFAVQLTIILCQTIVLKSITPLMCVTTRSMRRLLRLSLCVAIFAVIVCAILR